MASAICLQVAVPTTRALARSPVLRSPSGVRRVAARAVFPANCRLSCYQQPRWMLRAVALAEAKAEAEEEEEESAEEESGIAPSALEIQALLTDLCDGTSIAELDLKIGDFQLHVLRDVRSKKFADPVVAAAPAPVFTPPPVPSRPMSDFPGAPATPAPKYESDSEDEVDESLVHQTAPKVGIFRRGRPIKGKPGRPVVTEGVQVKLGQSLGFLEQLGTYQAIESEHAGEVVAFEIDDGDAVGYGDKLVAIRPSFPGIKKLG